MDNNLATTAYTLPQPAEIRQRIQDAPTIFTWRLKFQDQAFHRAYEFLPGQFNMLYLPGIGEIPVSIVSDPEHDDFLHHTIRLVGRVTRGMGKMQVGDVIGVRGPFGKGWPIDIGKGRDILVVTGGLGCAPVVSMINYVLKRPQNYGKLSIVQGVKHSADLIWRERYERWMQSSNVQVLLAADQANTDWRWHVGLVTELLDRVETDPDNTVVMICGPEIMMIKSAEALLQRGYDEVLIWLSMERNMQCGFGSCGHCQIGPKFVCHHGPVFHYPEIKPWLGLEGF